MVCTGGPSEAVPSIDIRGALYRFDVSLELRRCVVDRIGKFFREAKVASEPEDAGEVANSFSISIFGPSPRLSPKNNR